MTDTIAHPPLPEPAAHMQSTGGRAIAAVLRNAAIGPDMGMWLSAWIPSRIDKDGAFEYAYESMPDAYSFNFLSEHERRMFLLFCSYAAEDEA